MSLRILSATDNFTRPNNTTAYAVGQLVANNVAANVVHPFTLVTGAGGVRLRRFRLTKLSTVVTNSLFRLHLFGSSPTVVNGDGGAISFNVSDYIGNVDLPLMLAASDLAYTWVTSNAPAFPDGAFQYLTNTAIYVLLEARAAYTPVANEQFTLLGVYEKY